jgi:hypothetical protein
MTEPYFQMEEDGYEFPEEPTLEDYLEQLQFSIRTLEENDPNVLFDRCPVDFLAYLRVHPDAESTDWNEWRSLAREALCTLDLVVLVGIEHPDRIVLPENEDRAFRSRMDEALRTLLFDEELASGVEVLEVHGHRMARLNQVLRWIR